MPGPTNSDMEAAETAPDGNHRPYLPHGCSPDPDLLVDDPHDTPRSHASRRRGVLDGLIGAHRCRATLVIPLRTRTGHSLRGPHPNVVGRTTRLIPTNADRRHAARRLYPSHPRNRRSVLGRDSSCTYLEQISGGWFHAPVALAAVRSVADQYWSRPAGRRLTDARAISRGGCDAPPRRWPATRESAGSDRQQGTHDCPVPNLGTALRWSTWRRRHRSGAGRWNGGEFCT